MYNVSPSACSCRHPTNGLVHRDHAFPRTTLCTQSCSAATISSPFSTEPVWLRLALHRPLHPRGRSLVRLLPRNMVTQWGDPSPSSSLARARPHMHTNACAYTQDRPRKEHTNRHRISGPPRLKELSSTTDSHSTAQNTHPPLPNLLHERMAFSPRHPVGHFNCTIQ